MQTKTPTPRVHREVRIEPAHAVEPVAEHKNVLLRTYAPSTLSPELSSVHSCSAQPSVARMIRHLSQIAKTSLPLVLVDCLVLTAGLLLSSTMVSLVTGSVPHSLRPAPELFSSGIVYLLMYGLLGLYPGIGVNPIVELRNMVLGTIAAGAVLCVFAVAFHHWNLAQAIFIASLTLFALITVPVMRVFTRAALAKCPWWGQPVLIVGSGVSSSKLFRVLSQKVSLGLRPVGIVHDQPSLASGDPWVIGRLSDIPDLVDKHDIYWAVIAPGGKNEQELARSLQHCNSIPNVVMIPGFEEFPSLWNQSQDFGGVMGIRFRERLLDPWAQFCKRAFDVVAVVLGLIVFSPVLIPLFLLTWCCMKICSPGPVFYGQERVGKDGHRFQAWKFRTMVLNAEAALTTYLQQHPEMKAEWDTNQKLRNDPRIIPGIGNFLRKTSLDEIPQLWNVLCGEMSLVGPRPFMTEQTEIYGDGLSLYRKVRPGITGMWQISGRNFTTFEERAKWDAYYVRNWSFWLDIFILGRTIKTVLLREGAF